MIEYRFANAQDMDAIIDFINMIFSMMRVPHDFPTLLPKVYDRKYNTHDMHAIAVEDGRICGVVAVYPYDLKLGKETLKAGYVGSVSVHKRVRGMGVMKHLMNMHIDRTREQGYDMLLLGGQRQRYGYYGFANCGANHNYSISAANARHAWKDVLAEGICFAPMTEADAKEAFALYEQQLMHGARDENNFLDTLYSYKSKPWTITKEGQFFGYAVSSADCKRITELVLKDDEAIPAVLKAWLASQYKGTIEIQAATFNLSMNQVLAPVCEWFEISPNGMLLSLNPARVAEVYMKLKNQLKPLCDGECRIGYGEQGTLLMQVKDGEIRCTWTEDQPDKAYTELDAQHLLYGFNPYTVEKPVNLPHNWLPLPLHIPEPDTF